MSTIKFYNNRTELSGNFYNNLKSNNNNKIVIGFNGSITLTQHNLTNLVRKDGDKIFLSSKFKVNKILQGFINNKANDINLLDDPTKLFDKSSFQNKRIIFNYKFNTITRNRLLIPKLIIGNSNEYLLRNVQNFDPNDISRLSYIENPFVRFQHSTSGTRITLTDISYALPTSISFELINTDGSSQPLNLTYIFNQFPEINNNQDNNDSRGGGNESGGGTGSGGEGELPNNDGINRGESDKCIIIDNCRNIILKSTIEKDIYQLDTINILLNDDMQRSLITKEYYIYYFNIKFKFKNADQITNNNLVNNIFRLFYNNNIYNFTNLNISLNNDIITATSKHRYFEGQVINTFETEPIDYRGPINFIATILRFKLIFNILCNPNFHCPLPALPDRREITNRLGSMATFRMQFSQNIQNSVNKRGSRTTRFIKR